jgi:ribonuclease R
MARAARRPEGRAVLVASRRGRYLVGEPLFERGGQLPLARGRVRLSQGGIALCRIDRRGAQPLVDLGRADRARDVVAALLAERGLRPTFPNRLESEAETAVASLAADPGPRRDLTSEPTFTVDPATAHDFDDAVSARREGDGARVWVHIADVAAHVRPESGLDRGARERANSTYAPGIVAPMLPRSLSNEACSLNPGVERLAVTAEVELDAGASVRSASFYRSRVRSDERLDYDGLDRIFSGAARAPEPIAEALEVARSVASALADRAIGRALEVGLPEPEFEFTDEGHVAAAHAVPETEAHRLIELLMILTNEQVALLLERKGVPTLYRVHEQPDPARIVRMIEQLASLEVPTPPLPDRLSPTEAGALAARASSMAAAEARRRGHGAGSFSSLVLRSLRPARYSEENEGHAGLALPAYTHFTSPIRRYPDLVAHRALLSTLGAGEDAPDRHDTPAVAEHCSERERDSMRIERDGDDICLAFLLERELFEQGWGESFEGEVSGVVGAGAFVRFRGEMADVYEGFLPARRIAGDRYELNEHDSALVGIRTGRRVAIGDPIEVRVDGVEAPRGRVDLLPASDRSGRSRRGRGRSGGGRR